MVVVPLSTISNQSVKGITVVAKEEGARRVCVHSAFLRVSVPTRRNDVCVLKQEDCDSEQCDSSVRQLALESGTENPSKREK